MKKLKLSKDKLKFFIKNLKKEDEKEFRIFLNKYSINDFIKICFENESNTDFIGDDSLRPLILGGVCPLKDNKKQAQIWLLCTKFETEYKKEVYKYIKNKIEDYKKEYDFLFNHIYKSNFKSLKWLKKLGFKIKDIDENFKLFYFKKEI